MKLSWKAATLALLSSLAAGDAAFASTCRGIRPSSSLGMVRPRRSLLPSTMSLLAPSQIFREMDRITGDSFSGLDDFFDAPLMLIPLSPFSERADRLSDFAIVRRPQPTYKVTEDEDKVDLVVIIPGAKAEDLKADLEQNGRVIRLSGVSKVDEDGVSIESRFEKAFVLGRPGEKFDEDSIVAKMNDGVLTITAPKVKEGVKEVRNILITEEKPPVLPAQEEKQSDKVEAKQDIKKVDQLKEEGKEEKKLPGEDDGEEDLEEDAVIEL